MDADGRLRLRIPFDVMSCARPIYPARSTTGLTKATPLRGNVLGSSRSREGPTKQETHHAAKRSQR